jgi:hypothetical protein
MSELYQRRSSDHRNAKHWWQRAYWRTSDFADRNPLAAWVLLVISVAAGFFMVQANIDQVNKERQARFVAQTSVNAYFCGQNNEQDRILARLVEVSLNGGNFGDDIDPATLTPFDLEVLATIAKVQSAGGKEADELQRVFKRKLAALKDKAKCRELALELARAVGADPKTVESIEIIDLGPRIQEVP